ncbi:hypothetical protein VTG60DRAFT_3888 [Thermothelomyces hinnuleus]
MSQAKGKAGPTPRQRLKDVPMWSSTHQERGQHRPLKQEDHQWSGVDQSRPFLHFDCCEVDNTEASFSPTVVGDIRRQSVLYVVDVLSLSSASHKQLSFVQRTALSLPAAFYFSTRPYLTHGQTRLSRPRSQALHCRKMAIKIGACRTCGPFMQAELDKRPGIIMEHNFKNYRHTWTINIAGDPRTADPKSLFAMAWKKAASSNIFYCHQTKVVDNMICCNNY